MRDTFEMILLDNIKYIIRITFIQTFVNWNHKLTLTEVYSTFIITFYNLQLMRRVKNNAAILRCNPEAELSLQISFTLQLLVICSNFCCTVDQLQRPTEHSGMSTGCSLSKNSTLYFSLLLHLKQRIYICCIITYHDITNIIFLTYIFLGIKTTIEMGKYYRRVFISKLPTTRISNSEHFEKSCCGFTSYPKSYLLKIFNGKRHRVIAHLTGLF